jgi:putative phage-type endonuclease
MPYEIIDVKQGSAEWHALRKTKITATDAPIIMGVSPWKSRYQLYHEKMSPEVDTVITDRMQRGIDLEPVARDLFCIQTGFNVYPAVAVRDWAMASLDGMSLNGKIVLEIKCPGEKDHALALQGKIPEYYYPQLQHQMFVSGVDSMYYFSFDGIDGTAITVKRDDEYIQKMVNEEYKFYQCLQNKTPPEPQENDYIERSDDLWVHCASQWVTLNNTMKALEKEEEILRNQLIQLSGETNCKGGGISLCQVKRKGSVDYSSMIKKLAVDNDLIESFRKPEINSWRLTAC